MFILHLTSVVFVQRVLESHNFLYLQEDITIGWKPISLKNIAEIKKALYPGMGLIMKSKLEKINDFIFYIYLSLKSFSIISFQHLTFDLF